MSQLAEGRSSGHKVGLAVQLHQGSDSVSGVDIGLDQALLCLPAQVLLGRCQPLPAENLHCLVQIPVRLLQSLLAVKDSSTGPLAQFFH